MMIRLFVLFACLAGLPICGAVFAADAQTSAKPTLILVKGAAGEEEYAKQFSDWCSHWQKGAEKAQMNIIKVGFDDISAADKQHSTDKELLSQGLEKEPKTGPAELWLVLIGHGTFDGKEAKFNLRGPDFSATELAKWLEPFQRPLAIIDTSAASAPFLNKLSGKNRIIITSTRSGHEQNFSHFGQYLSEVIADPAADLDKDGQTSLLEAWLLASRRLTAFYEADHRLATEHPLLDDNGDGHGTPPDWFRGIYATKKSNDNSALDGIRAHQWHLVRGGSEQQWPAEMRARRDQLESAIIDLRQAKSKFSEDEYYKKLENYLTDMALLYEQQSTNKIKK
ncbi:MAG TPA: hypothetical protein VGE41_06630 [Verrucomicrobiae bacterium]